MATNNAINLSASGIAKYDGAGNFSAITTTQHYAIVGASSNGLTSVNPGSTSGVPLISQGGSSDPVFGTALVAGGGTGATSFNTNGVVISNTSGTGALASLSLTAGQVVIGSSTTPAAATLSAGGGITIANGNNSITISSSSGGFTVTDVTGATQTLAAQNAYITDHTNVTYTLPASGALGDTILIVGKLGLATVAQNANQQILFGSSSTTVGTMGSIVSTNVGDCVTLFCSTSGASAIWRVTSSVGNWSVL